MKCFMAIVVEAVIVLRRLLTVPRLRLNVITFIVHCFCFLGRCAVVVLRNGNANLNGFQRIYYRRMRGGS